MAVARAGATLGPRRRQGTAEDGGSIALSGAVQSCSCCTALVLAFCHRAAALGGTVQLPFGPRSAGPGWRRRPACCAQRTRHGTSLAPAWTAAPRFQDRGIKHDMMSCMDHVFQFQAERP